MKRTFSPTHTPMKSTKKDKKEKGGKHKHVEKELTHNKKSKEKNDKSKDTKRHRDREAEDQSKKPKKDEPLAPKQDKAPADPQLPDIVAPSVPDSQVVDTPMKDATPLPLPLSFVISPGANTQRTVLKPRKHPYHWRNMLSDEMLERLALLRVVQAGSNKFMEGGWSVVYKNEDGKYVPWQSNTPILRVVSATIHGVGLMPQEKKGDENRIYKLKLEADVDEELAKEDPQIAIDQQDFAARMDAMTLKIGQLLFGQAKASMIEGIFKKNMERLFDMKPEQYGLKKPYEQLSPKDKIAVMQEYLPAYMKDQGAIREVFREFMGRMTTYVFRGDDKFPEDKVPTFRMQTKSFFKKKEKENTGNEGSSEGGARKVPGKFSGARNDAKSNKQDVEELKDGEDGQGGNDGQDVESYDLDDEDRRYDDLPDEKVNAIVTALRKLGFIHRRMRYKNHDGSKKNLGKYEKDRNYRVVDQGDYVQTELRFWVYSLSGDAGRFGYKEQLGNNVWYIRQGTRKADVPISEESKIGRIEGLRPKELSISSTLAPPKEPKSERSESDDSSSGSEREN